MYYDAYTILMGLLLRNIHPDPHVILNMTEMSQASYISWFSEFIAASLEDCHVPGSCYGADTRVDLLAKVGNESRAPFKYLLDIIIDVPVASFGGARFLFPGCLGSWTRALGVDYEQLLRVVLSCCQG